MALGAIEITNLVAQGLKGLGGLAQGITGFVQQRNLWKNRPLLGVTEGEKANDILYKQMASATEMPGQRRTEEKLGQAVSEGIYGAQQGAISSLGATQAAVDLNAKKMQAIQDLAGQFAEYKAQRMDALGQWNKQKTELEQQRFQVNQFDPWNIKMNEAIGRKQAGFSAAGSALDSGLSILTDYAGTQNYLKMLQAMNPNFGK